MLTSEITAAQVGWRVAQAARGAGYACLLLFFLQSSASADEPEKEKQKTEEAGAAKEVVEKSAYPKYLRAAGEYHRKRLHLAMKLRREEIDRAVEFDAKQSKNIEIAAKGAVDRVIDRWLEQMLSNSDLEIQFGQMQADQAKASLIGMGAGISVDHVTQEEIWKSGVNQQFSDGQRKLYEKMVAERKAFERGVSISQLVVQLDRLLRFSEQQRQEMTSLLDRVLDEDFAFQNSASTEVIFARAFMNQHVAGVAPDPFAPAPAVDSSNPLGKVSNDEVGKVLSDTQLERWRALRNDPSALFYSGHGGGVQWMEAGPGNFLIDGAFIELNGLDVE